MSDAPTPTAPPPIATACVVVWEHDVTIQPSVFPAGLRALFGIDGHGHRIRVVRRETRVGGAVPRVAYLVERRVADACGSPAWFPVAEIAVPHREDGALVLGDTAPVPALAGEVLALLLEQARAKGSA